MKKFLFTKKNKKNYSSIIHGWKSISENFIKELNFKTYEFEHVQTGAKYLHIGSDDQNNSFSITFTTPPPNSMGLPHILEHTTLCGSKNYPVRDPFFNMLKRSLNTYMNAWTGILFFTFF
jgi:presequence protease